MKILIAGLGSIGRRHLRNLRALGEHDVILYRTHRSTLPDEELSGLPVETDLPAALAHRPDAVIVANPTALHLPVAIPAAEAGCHLLLEKPVSHSLEGLDELQAAVDRNHVRVLVGYQFRFHPGLQQAAQIIQSGRLGRLVSVHAHWGEYLPGWHPWEDYRQSYSARLELGGGVVLTLSHPLDYLRWLVGEVQAVGAIAGRLGDLELDVEDTAEISLRFANRAIGSLHLDYNQRPAEHYLSITGTQGTLRWNNADGLVSVYTASQEPTAGDGWQHFPVPTGFERNHLFLAELKHFLEVVQGQAEPVCSLHDGRRALEVGLAALESARQGCLVEA